MNQPNPFLTELLQRGASGFAGFAAGLLIERLPDAGGKYPPDAFSSWKVHLTQRVIELAAAIGAGEPKLFHARIAWSRKAFLAHDRNVDDLKLSLEVLREVLMERLPEHVSEDCSLFIDEAVEAFDADSEGLDESFLDPAVPAGKMALQYLQLVLEGNVSDAIAKVTRAAQNGMDAAGVYTDVLMPAQREIGRLWHLGDVTVAEEHLVSFATQRAMAILANSAPDVPGNGKTVITAAVAGNIHDIGLRAVADLYQIAGWRSIFLGSDVPMRDLPAMLTFFEADLFLLGAMLSTHIQKVAETIQVIRDRCERDVKIIVGGAAFDEAPQLWRRNNSDGYADSIEGAVALGSSLLKL
ncbi:MAG: cobalamin-dependent protein [Gammaproteobacteria bacterium]|nr:cobalamin-dependent protein [Gammaproteobacteria bacterium]